MVGDSRALGYSNPLLFYSVGSFAYLPADRGKSLYSEAIRALGREKVATCRRNTPFVHRAKLRETSHTLHHALDKYTMQRRMQHICFKLYWARALSCNSALSVWRSVFQWRIRLDIAMCLRAASCRLHFSVSPDHRMLTSDQPVLALTRQNVYIIGFDPAEIWATPPPPPFHPRPPPLPPLA